MGVKEKVELGKVVLVEVIIKDKELFWGYIFKVVDDLSIYEGLVSVRIYLGRKVVLEGRVVLVMFDFMLLRMWIEFCRMYYEDMCEVIIVMDILVLRLVDCEL